MVTRWSMTTFSRQTGPVAAITTCPVVPPRFVFGWSGYRLGSGSGSGKLWNLGFAATRSRRTPPCIEPFANSSPVGLALAFFRVA